MDSPDIFYHEDFYRQIELVPEENYFSANKFIHELSSKEISQYGTFKITARPEQHVRLLDRNIPIIAIRQLLNPISLIYSKKVKTGYGRSAYLDEYTEVWGFEQYGIFVKRKNDLTEAIWICDSVQFGKSQNANHLQKALYAVMDYYSLILIDWNKELICRADSENTVKEYLIANLSFNY